MIIRIHSSGQSFASLSKYLCHDPQADTAKRVAWTHTLNCTHDHVPSAVHEMYTTQLDAEALKREAGVRGGTRIEKPVKHFSLSWDPTDNPTREHTIASVESFLTHMGWQAHQAVLVSHNDTEHPHVHVMLNAVHPETGLKLNDGYEWRRAEQWGLQYEIERGNVLCEQRLKNVAEREENLTREAWQTMKDGERQHAAHENERRAWDASYLGREENREIRETEEWKLLKSHQREEREAFFAGGKKAYGELRASVYRDVRQEFRDEWAGFYALARDGVEDEYLDRMKEGILERQRWVLQQRRDAACADLRQERDRCYADILQHQLEARHELHDRQEQGLNSPHLLDLANGGSPRHEITSGVEAVFDSAAREVTTKDVDIDAEFGAAAEEVTRDENAEPFTFGGATVHDGRSDVVEREGGSGSSRDIGADTASAGIAAFAGAGEKLFDGFFGSGPPKKDKPPAKDPNPFARSAEKAIHKAMDEEQKKRDRDYWDDRDRSRD